MVVFGLFHGLIFLPAALSIAGPEPYGGNHEQQEEETDLEKHGEGLKTDLNREERRRKVSPVQTLSVRSLDNEDAGLGLENPCFQGV